MEIVLDLLLSGVDFVSFPDTGGKECLEFISFERRVLETVLAFAIFVRSISAGFWRLERTALREHSITMTKLSIQPWLLCLTIITFLLELGYKVLEKKVILITMSCHLLLLIQIYLLSEVQKHFYSLKSFLFRIHLFFLHAPVMATLFPETNHRSLPGHAVTFWTEHFLLLFVPVVLTQHYRIPIKNFRELLNWSLMAYGIWGIYNFIVIQPLAMVSQVNINFMLCPSVADPFHGTNYRLFGLVHQFIQIFLSGLIYSCIAHWMVYDDNEVEVVAMIGKKQRRMNSVTYPIYFSEYRKS